MFKKVGSLVLGLIVIVSLAACSSLQTADASGIYVSIDINPSIEFIVDEEGIVESYNLLNEDAEILCADVDFVGMTIEDATELFIQLATDAGFIDLESEDNAILITVIGDDEEDSELPLQLQERIRTRAMAFMVRNSINGQVFTEDFTSADLIAQANELGISPGKLKLILLAQEFDPELTIEQGIDTPVKDLVKGVQAAHKEQIANMTPAEKAELLQQKTQLMEQFQNRLQEHLELNTELTDEEIAQIVEQAKLTIRTTTRAQWEEAADAWRQRFENRNDNSSNGNNE